MADAIFTPSPPADRPTTVLTTSQEVGERWSTGGRNVGWEYGVLWGVVQVERTQGKGGGGGTSSAYVVMVIIWSGTEEVYRVKTNNKVTGVSGGPLPIFWRTSHGRAIDVQGNCWI